MRPYSLCKTCACCGSDNTVKVLQLADTPMEDQFRREPGVHDVYPLEVSLCEYCSFAFLTHQIDPSLSYSDYIYNTNITVGLVDHYRAYALEIVAKLGVPKNSLAFDIGSNDGTMVEALKSAGLRVFGVEPAQSIVVSANSRNRPTIHGFFSKKLSETLVNDYGKAALITANYMFANIAGLDDFLEGITNLLDDNGYFVVQTGYHPDQFRVKMFDYIYHEHFSYFTVKSLNKLFDRHGLSLVGVERKSPKGGSIRVIATKRNSETAKNTQVMNFIQEEDLHGWSTPQPFVAMQAFLNSRRLEVRSQLKRLQKDGKVIAAFGASHSTTTFLYYFDIAEFITCIFDDNELKHGTFSPGYNIPVHPGFKLVSNAPDVTVLLAWQHQKSILDRHQNYLENNGVFLVPLPDLRLVAKADR